jgi:hypothetical protein
MNPRFKNASMLRRRLRIVVPGLLIFLAACASAPPVPEVSLQSAQQAIANAERVDAASLAPVELGEARAKLAAAQKAVEQEHMVAAAQFADQARVEADLAAAKTGALKALAVNQDIKKGTATLVEEMQRKTGESR